MDSVFCIEARGNVANHVFDELRVVVGAFGDKFFIGPLEQSVKLAGSFRLDELNDLLDPNKFVEAGRNRDM